MWKYAAQDVFFTVIYLLSLKQVTDEEVAILEEDIIDEVLYLSQLKKTQEETDEEVADGTVSILLLNSNSRFYRTE